MEFCELKKEYGLVCNGGLLWWNFEWFYEDLMNGVLNMSWHLVKKGNKSGVDQLKINS